MPMPVEETAKNLLKPSQENMADAAVLSYFSLPRHP